MIYLGTKFGSNIELAIKCTRYYRTKGRPFTAEEVNIERQKLKNLANKGILKIVSGGKARNPNCYIVPQITIELLERRFPDEL